jgi:putative sterol carrier protein
VNDDTGGQSKTMSTQEYATEQFFPTEPWLQEYHEAINDDEEYAEDSEGWGVDFDGEFIFHITDVPLAERTVADLPEQIVGLIDETFDDLSDERLEEIVAAAPDDVRSAIESRDGGVREAAYDELMAVSLDEIADWMWPELEEEVPPLLVDLIEQVDQYIVDGDTVYAYIDLYDGECREVDVVTSLDERGYGFVISGEYDDWKDLVGGEAGIIDQLMGGVMELDGDMQKILQYSDAAVRLTDVAADTESRFLF